MKTLASLFFVSIFLFLASPVFVTVNAEETTTPCTPVYGGGEVCGSYTPAPTGLDTPVVLYSSLGLYSTGLLSLVASQKVKDLVPRK